MNPTQSSETKPGKPKLPFNWVIAAILVLTAVVFWSSSRPMKPSEADERKPAASRKSPERAVISPSETAEQSTSSADHSNDSSATDRQSNNSTGPEKTRASRRDEVVDAAGKRKTQIDPMASWTDQPAWPEGPKMYAEVETSSRRYINLRPDDIGEMPRVRAEAEERLELKLTFPEGEPGEKIHVELPNGGAFADTEARGRVYVLPKNRTLSFPFIADDTRGHCNVKLHHRGHSRSLPVWVGELPEFATADSGS